MQVVPGLDAELAAYRQLAADNRVDGVIVADLRVDDPRPRMLADLGLPAVTLGRPEGRRRCPAVVLEDVAGVVASVEHLANLGHQRIAFVSGPDPFLHARNRRQAWRSTLRRLDLRDDLTIDGDFSGASGAKATAQLLRRRAADRPTAIVYANDLMAVAGVATIARSGRRVPDDVSVVGYDDIAVAAHMHPALTTVMQDATAWGRARHAQCSTSSRMDSPTMWNYHLPVSSSENRPPHRRAQRNHQGGNHEAKDHGSRRRHCAGRHGGWARRRRNRRGRWTVHQRRPGSHAGPITIWLSNNAFEVEWGTAMVEAWNAEHPDEEITAQEIPAGRTSEEVIGAAITAGNAPCLVFNTAPAAVPTVPAPGRAGRSRQLRRRRRLRRRPHRATAPISTAPPTAASSRCHGRPTR